jgi:hypothetical protein
MKLFVTGLTGYIGRVEHAIQVGQTVEELACNEEIKSTETFWPLRKNR